MKKSKRKASRRKPTLAHQTISTLVWDHRTGRGTYLFSGPRRHEVAIVAHSHAYTRCGSRVMPIVDDGDALAFQVLPVPRAKRRAKKSKR